MEQEEKKLGKTVLNFFSKPFFSFFHLGRKQISVFSQEQLEQKGTGFFHNTNEFVHHSSLPHQESAFFSFTSRQEFLLVGIIELFILALLIQWRLTIIVLFAALTIFYFVDLLFNFFLILRSFHTSTEMIITENDLADYARRNQWPLYTIFCPLHKEWQVVPQFIEAMKALEYPVDRLQIMLLLEEDDKPTIAKVEVFNLPENFDVILVPHSLPKTKPKAMNYGLRFVRGEYITIFDAEDIPDPKQLKKAVVAFERASSDTACIQAKLNFYNPNQNFLTRIFTAEYSLWFDLVLPGLQSIGAPIPLGGTSNHFRAAQLKRLGGWDAFNVTEDCDLGMRLAKRGFRTAMIDSTTLEEANSDLLNWYRQRSRWVKGYMQTYLVHMREPKEFIKDKRKHHLPIFQLVVGGKILSMFINPLLWVVTFCYFAFRSSVGVFIESFFPTPILYIGAFSLIFGNFLYLFYYMVGCARRGLWDTIKYVYLVPFYWLGMSAAAWQGLYEVFAKPHYWAKTVHGLHLESPQPIIDARPIIIPEAITASGAFVRAILSSIITVLPDPGALVFANHKSIEARRKIIPEPSSPGVSFIGKFLSDRVFSGAGLLVVASIISSFVNFAYNAFLGRKLSAEDFGMLALFNTFAALTAIVIGPIGFAVTYKTAYNNSASDQASNRQFFWKTLQHGLFYTVLASVILAVTAPLIAPFFHISSLVLVYGFTPFLVLSIVSVVSRGYLQGRLFFATAALVTVAECLIKITSAVLLVYLHLGSWTTLSLPLSVLVAGFLAYWVVVRKMRNESSQGLPSSQDTKFPKGFYGATVLTGFSAAAFLSLDLVLAKHYLSPDQAGHYALLSVIGKMIFFFGSLLSPFIVTFVRRDEGAGKNPVATFHRLLAATGGLTLLAYLGLGPLGGITVPILLGDKASAILPYLNTYGLAIVLFTLTAIIIQYHIVRNQYGFSLFAASIAISLWLGITVMHGSVFEIARVLLLTSWASFGLALILHLFTQHGRFVLRNLVDFVDAFSPQSGFAAAQNLTQGKRILIFNWRDIKHSFAGGAEVYVNELATRWAADGHSVTLFCGNDGNHSRNEVLEGVRIVRRGGFYLVYFWAFFYYLLHFRGKFDVIVDCQNGVPFFTPLYAKEPVFCLMHHVHQEVFYKYLSKPMAMVAAFLERVFMPFVYQNTKFITISNSSKQEMQNLGLGRAGIEIVYPGINLESLRPAEKSQRPLVLYLGRLKAYKSVDVLIHSFKNILSQMPNALLAIVGGGEESDNLRLMVKRMQLEDKVIFTGKVSEEEKITWLQKAWVLVNPSMMEGWGITSLEANACGVPVIAADVPGLRDSVQNPHTGYLVEHGNVKKFSGKILYLLQHKILRQAMGERGIAWAQNFDWNKSSQKFLASISSPPLVPAKQVAGGESPSRANYEAVLNQSALPTVTIAIPAYNEQDNIEFLLRSVLKQNTRNFIPKRLVIYCDGSTDSTPEKVRNFYQQGVDLVWDPINRGKVAVLNQIYSECDSDILITLDADIGLMGSDCLDNLVGTLRVDPQAVITVAHQVPLRAENLFGKLLHSSIVLWDCVRLSIPHRDHVQNFGGAAVAYRANFTKSLQVPDDVANHERLYLYLKAKSLNGFRYCADAKIAYWPVATWEDYLRLTRRPFGRDNTELDNLFGFKTSSYCDVQTKYKFIGMAKSFQVQPMLTIPAILLGWIMARLTIKVPVGSTMLWERTPSSKKSLEDVLSDSTKKDIIISSYDDVNNPYYGGGGALAVHAIAKRLVSTYNVTVLTGKYPNSKNELIDKVHYRRVGISWLGPKSGQLCFSFCLPFLIFRRKFDVWIESFTPPFSTGFLPLFTKKPVIGLAHMLSGAEMRRKYGRIFEIIERLGLRVYRRIITPSLVAAKRIKHFNPKAEVVVIPNGLEAVEETENVAKNYILFMGRIEVEQKGLDILLEAFAKVKDRIPYPLYIAGSGDKNELSKLLNLINSLGLSEHVQLQGKVSGEQKQMLYNNASFVVMPSRFETFPLVALEAMSHGKALLSFKIDGLSWLPKDACCQVPLFSVDQLAEAMVNLSNDHSLLERLGREGQVFAKSFAWDQLFIDYESFISKSFEYAPTR